MNRFLSVGEVQWQMERLLVYVFSCKMSTPDQYEEEREEKEEKYKNQNEDVKEKKQSQGSCCRSGY